MIRIKSNVNLNQIHGNAWIAHTHTHTTPWIRAPSLRLQDKSTNVHASTTLYSECVYTSIYCSLSLSLALSNFSFIFDRCAEFASHFLSPSLLSFWRARSYLLQFCWLLIMLTNKNSILKSVLHYVPTKSKSFTDVHSNWMQNKLSCLVLRK